MTIRNVVTRAARFARARQLTTVAAAAIAVPLAMPAQSVLLPGSTLLVTNQLVGSAGSFRMTQSTAQDTTSHELGAITYERQLVPHVQDRGGAPGILMIHRGEFGAHRSVDSALFLVRGLAPVWEVSRFDSTVTRFTYDGKHVTYVRTSADSGERRNEHTYQVPVFMWQGRDELLQSLPLRVGYTAIVPLYSEGDLNIEMDTVRVVKSDASNHWTIYFADPVIVATTVIDGTTRAITSYSHTMRKSGRSMRYVIGN